MSNPVRVGAFAQIELENLIDGRKLNERWRADDRIEVITLNQKVFTFLYE